MICAPAQAPPVCIPAATRATLARMAGQTNRTDPRDDAAPMRTVLRTMEVLRALNTRNGATVTELSRRTGISRPALYRMLETLREAGYVGLDLSRRRYGLTMLIRGLAEGFNEEDWITEVARPVLRKLQKQVLWPVDLGIFMDNLMWIRETTRASSTLTIDRGVVGNRLPVLRAATGRAYLAFCGADERAQIVANLIEAREPGHEFAADRPAFEAMLDRIRANGYGERFGEEPHESGAIAVPILAGDRVLGCVNMTFIRRSMGPQEAAARYLGQMQRAAAEIASGAASLGADS